MQVSHDNVLLQIFRWFKRRQLALTESRYDGKIMKEIMATVKEGAQIDICPIMRTVFIIGPFVTMPLWLIRFVVLPVGAVAVVGTMLLGGLGVAIYGGYAELSHYATQFDVTAALTEAGIVLAVIAGLVLLWRPIFWMFMGLLIGFVYVCMGAAWLFPRIGNFVFGRVPTQAKKPAKRRQESETLALIRAWLKGIHDQFCMTATVSRKAQPA